MRNKNKAVFQISLLVTFLLFFSALNYAQQSEKLVLPELNLVPSGLAKASSQLYTEKNQQLKAEIVKLAGEKKITDQKNKDLTAGSAKEIEYQAALALHTAKVNDLTQKINTFNTEIEGVVYKDPAIDKLSMITYFTLKKDQKLWDDFQKKMTASKIILKQDKVRINQELTKIHSKKQKIKTSFNEGVILSMYTEQADTTNIQDSLKSPFTGITYKEMDTNMKTNQQTDSGVVIVSFVMPKKVNDPREVASRRDGHVPSESFSLASISAKAELTKLKDKKFNRLIAHSNGATVVECLINDSLIEVNELNIIGGEKSLINGQALQSLLENGTVKRIVVWIKLDDPAIWITSLKEEDITERTQNFISYKSKNDARSNSVLNSKVEYKWLLNTGSLALLNAQDPQFIATYFKEISNEFRTK